MQINSTVSSPSIKPPQLSAVAQMAIAALLASLFLLGSWIELVNYWLESPEFGHGLLLCALAFYITWSARGVIDSLSVAPSILGHLLMGLGLLLHLVSLAGDVQVTKFYSLIIVLASCPIALFGLQTVKAIRFPLLLLFFSIPLHPSLNTALTSYLQLVSSDIGVWFIRTMGMAALQDGNVINMGSFVLLVEEACSGLRYLLPLFSMNLIVAYYLRCNWIAKSALIISAIPITVFTNSLRIALTGLIIKFYGAEAAQGFLHDFEGLAVFGLACSLTVIVLLVISVLQGNGLKLHKNFHAATPPITAPLGSRKVSVSAYALLAVILIGGASNIALIYFKSEVIPARQEFSQFPLSVHSRDLYPDTLEDKFIEILQPDDYFIGDFLADGKPPINLYMAYYASQKNGSLIHSPKQCIPAGGWQIVNEKRIDLADMGFTGKANRAIIQKDQTSLLVYYWVHQQGVNYASDSRVYLSLIQRSILYSRTDGALVRLIIPINDGQEVQAELQLQAFAASLKDVLPKFLPQ